VLVTHNRIKGAGPLRIYNDYCGQQRSLIVWDESLLVSETRAISFIELQSAFGWIAPRVDGTAPVLRYLRHALDALNAELQRQQRRSGIPRPIKLPELDDRRIGEFKQTLGSSAIVDPLRQVIEMSTQPLRAVYTTHGAGLVTYDWSCPVSVDGFPLGFQAGAVTSTALRIAAGSG
jgi:hypothetical protein